MGRPWVGRRIAAPAFLFALFLAPAPRHHRVSHVRSPIPKTTVRTALERAALPIVSTSERPAHYTVRHRDVSAFFTDRGIRLAFFRDGKGWAMDWGISGAGPVVPRARKELPARVHHLAGEAASPIAFGEVVYPEVKAGTNLVVESRPHALKYSLELQPGVPAGALRMYYDGALNVRIVEGGKALEIRTGNGIVRENELLCYQPNGSGRRVIPARYSRVTQGSRPESWEYEIELRDVDPAHPVVVDPTISWSSYLGGFVGGLGSVDYAESTAVDAGGNIYVAGWTQAIDFPVLGGFDATLGAREGSNPYSGIGYGYSDAFVSKFSPQGTLMWSSYLGGTNKEQATAIAVDKNGYVYVTGTTNSLDLPTTKGAFLPSSNAWPGNAGFAVKMPPDGSSVVWATYLPEFEPADLAVDDTSGEVYFVGTTLSGTLTSNGPRFAGGADAYVLKLKADASDMVWALYLGGASADSGVGIAVDSAGQAYVAGGTQSLNLEEASGDFPGAPRNVIVDAIGAGFVSKVKEDGSGLLWSTVLAGSDWGSLADDIAVHKDSSDGRTYLYVAGSAWGTTFPTTPGAVQESFSGASDLFVVKMDTSEPRVFWSTLLGGSGSEIRARLALDAGGNVTVTGGSYSLDFPIAGQGRGSVLYDVYAGLNFRQEGFDRDTWDGTILTAQGEFYGNYNEFTGPFFDHYTLTYVGVEADLNRQDAIAAKLDPTGSRLLWSTYLGGSLEDDGSAIAVDLDGNTVVVGTTGQDGSLPNDFPVMPGAFDTTYSAPRDGFVARLKADGSADWTTYLGGTRDSKADDVTENMVVDAEGNVYVTGMAASNDFPTTTGLPLRGSTDAFVTKILASGKNIAWSTYLGGSGGDRGAGLALDGDGSVFVTGQTLSPDFPLATNAFGGLGDAFLARLDARDGTHTWSSYLGGGGIDFGRGVAANGTGVYVSGQTGSPDFPTKNGLLAKLDGPTDSFVSKFDIATYELVWSTFLGGESGEGAASIAINGSGTIFVAGQTGSRFFPGAGNSYRGNYDGFVARLNASGTALDWATYLGGSGWDRPTGIALDPNGNVVVMGHTESADFPTTVGAFDRTYGPNMDAFVSKLSGDNAQLVWSTFLGGSGTDYALAMTVDGQGNVWIGGSTGSRNFPMTEGALDTSTQNGLDGFAVELSPDGSTLIWSTYLGGLQDDGIAGIAVDGAGNIYLAGTTMSDDFPLVNAFDSTLRGWRDAFVTKISSGLPSMPPSPGVVFDGLGEDIRFQSFADTISANWREFQDNGLPIVAYEWAIGSTRGGTELQGFLAVGFVLRSTKTSLTLTPGATYFVSVRAVNAAGPGPAASSDGVTVDTSAPIPGEVSDGLAPPDIDFQVSLSAISANWTAFTDDGAGIVGYEWAVGTAPGAADVQPFVGVGLTRSAAKDGLTLAFDSTYYVTVRATDGVGWTGSASSDGVRIAYLLAERPATCLPNSWEERPGAAGLAAAHVRLSVGGEEDVRIEALRFSDFGMDGVASVALYLDVDRNGLYDPGFDSLLAESEDRALSFRNIRLLIPGRQSRDVLVVCCLSEDASGLRVQLAEATDIFAVHHRSGERIGAVGSFPLDGPEIRVAEDGSPTALYLEGGSATDAPTMIAAGERGVVLQQVQLRATSLGDVAIDGLQVEFEGTASVLRLIDDVNQNGTVDATDIEIAAQSSPGPAVAFVFTRAISAGANRKWLLVADEPAEGALGVRVAKTAFATSSTMEGCDLIEIRHEVRADAARLFVWNRPLPPARPALPFEKGVALLAFDVRADGSKPVLVEQAMMRVWGRAFDPSDIARAVLWRNARAIAQTERIGAGSLLFEIRETIDPGVTEIWTVTFDFAGWSAAEKDFQLFFDLRTGTPPFRATVAPTGGVGNRSLDGGPSTRRLGRNDERRRLLCVGGVEILFSRGPVPSASSLGSAATEVIR